MVGFTASSVTTPHTGASCCPQSVKAQPPVQTPTPVLGALYCPHGSLIAAARSEGSTRKQYIRDQRPSSKAQVQGLLQPPYSDYRVEQLVHLHIPHADAHDHRTTAEHIHLYHC